jgi:hypothetical protein
MQIFVSCVSKDFALFRDAINELGKSLKLSDQNLLFKDMYDPHTCDLPPEIWSMEAAAKSDLVIYILGKSHGELPSKNLNEIEYKDIEKVKRIARTIPCWYKQNYPDKLSYTQLEILAAEAAKVPIMVFVPKQGEALVDRDLEEYLAHQETEEWKRERQECFGNWVRDNHKNGFFKHRVDLNNQILFVIDKLSKKRRKIKKSILSVVLLSVVLFAGGYYFNQSYRSTVNKQKWLFALGSSIAMMGESLYQPGVPILEKALLELSFSTTQSKDLQKEYLIIDQIGRTNEGKERNIPVLREQFTHSISTQVAVLHGRQSSEFMLFGYHLSRLMLLYSNWSYVPENSLICENARFHYTKAYSLAEKMNFAKKMNLKQNEIGGDFACKESTRKRLLKSISEIVSIYSPEI